MTAITLHKFIRALNESGRAYSLTSVREVAVMVQIALPGERGEVEFFEDRDPEIEVFGSDGKIAGPDALARLFSGNE